MPLLLLFISGFIACAVLIIFSGFRLSKYGEIIAELYTVWDKIIYA